MEVELIQPHKTRHDVERAVGQFRVTEFQLKQLAERPQHVDVSIGEHRTRQVEGL